MSTDTKKKWNNKEKIQKYVVITCMSLVCAGCIWWAFAPSESDREKEALQAGLNLTVPDPANEIIIDNKKDAYEKIFRNNKREDQMASLEHYSEQLLQEQENTKIVEIEQSVNLPLPSVESSVSAYAEMNKNLTDLYQPYPTHQDNGNEQEMLELTWRIQELERKLQETNQQKDLMDQQYEMIEKSYQLAAKYLPQNNATNMPSQHSEEITLASPASNRDKKVIKTVKAGNNGIVSVLSPIMDSETLLAAYSQPRNIGFHTVGAKNQSVPKNTISACVNQTTTIKDGGEIQFRLLETLKVDDMVIPVNTLLIGTGRISKDRLYINISSIEYGGYIIPVSIEVYDTNGMPGLPVPGSEEVNAFKEVLAGSGNSLGSTITITQQNAVQQLGTDIGRGMLQGTSQYMSRKLREVKVTVKANHQVLLLPNDF